MLYRVNLEFKPTKIQLLSGVVSFNTNWILDRQKFIDWIYKEPILVDPMKPNSSYQHDIRQKMRDAGSNGYSHSGMFKVDSIEISSNIDEKELTADKLKNLQGEYVEIACKLNSKCEKVYVSFLINVDLYEGIHRLFRSLFVIPNDWLIEEKGFPLNEYSLREECYQELIAKEVNLVAYGYAITQKDTFLQIMNPSLYEKYALLRN
jgi:hypothetical protein